MNRLVIIGNGFDIAHGLKTGYNDFILEYLKKCFAICDDKRSYKDNLIEIKKNLLGETKFSLNNIKDTHDLVQFCYDNNQMSSLLRNKPISINANTQLNVVFQIEFVDAFFKHLVTNCTKSTWVEIENEFYTSLKKILHDQSGINFKNELEILNRSMNIIITELQAYLSTVKSNGLIERYKAILHEDINMGEIPSEKEEIRKINQTLLLSFNYTSTVEEYYKDFNGGKNPSFLISYIHGKLNDSSNPIIFGFGDELDEDYLKMEKSKEKKFFEYIKSFWYFKTKNYHDLIRFIDSSEYQIFILGHSCGLSDRTMLNMIFEHVNCQAIKIYFYDNGHYNNYTDLTQEISRHFRNKGEMRRKITSFPYCRPMPQLK